MSRVDLGVVDFVTHFPAGSLRPVDLTILLRTIRHLLLILRTRTLILPPPVPNTTPPPPRLTLPVPINSLRQSIYVPTPPQNQVDHIQTTPTIKPNTPNRPFLTFLAPTSRIPRSPMTQPTLPSIVRASLIMPILTMTVPPHNHRAHEVLGRHRLLSNNPLTSMSRISVIKMVLRAEVSPTSASTSM